MLTNNASKETNLSIQREDPSKPETRALLEKSDKFYASLYPEKSNHLLDVDSLKQPNVAFYAARLDNQLKGFGSVVLYPQYAELKRMYVDDSARGHGIGKKILNKLEEHAKSAGVHSIKLETGIKQNEAIRLYTSQGYKETEPFGEYTYDPLSIYMKKSIQG